MSKILQVIEPFCFLSIGDNLHLNENGTEYSITYDEHYGRVDATGEDFNTSFVGKFSISTEYAKELINEGYLSEVLEKQNFVNIFTEIDSLLQRYTAELNSINEDMKTEPVCVRVEKETVLSNMIKLLTHLKSLKK